MSKWFRKSSQEKPPERASEDDYDLLHTLCTVWPSGTYTQQYMKTQDRSIATLAAREIRQLIEASYQANIEIGQDHIELLKRIESD